MGCRTISECGSPAFTFGFSPTDPITSPGQLHHTIQSPQMSSPALSISSIVRPQISNFAGQSPALIYRSLPSHFANTYPPASSFHGSLNTIAASTQYRYRQGEEENIRREISSAEISLGALHPETLRRLKDLGHILIGQGRYKSAEEVVRKVL